MQFRNPEVFALLLLLPLYMWLYRHWRQSSRQGLPLPTFAWVTKVKSAFLWRLYLPGLFFLMACLLATVALARPQYGHEEVKKKQRGIDIMMVLDISGSMAAEDFLPNRLEAAKKVVAEFVRSQKGNRLGAVVFAGRSFTLMPLSTDYHLVGDAIKDVRFEMITTDGTAIGDAISNAVYRFRKDNLDSRVMVLLTDGENTAGQISPKVAAEVAKQQKVKIYTIGMGRSGGAPIPRINPQTGEKDYYRNPDGSYLLTSINEDDLQKIASMTGGMYFQADNNAKLTEIYKQITQMEKAEFEVRRIMRYQEQMAPFLFAGMLCLLLSWILSMTWCRVVRV